MTGSWLDQDALERRDLLGEYDPHTDPKGESMSDDWELEPLGGFTLDFLFALETADMFEDSSGILYFLEEPWKWHAECSAWCEHGQPQEHEDGWDEWVAACAAMTARP